MEEGPAFSCPNYKTRVLLLPIEVACLIASSTHS
ncbi:hypothetical protein ES319_D01G120300v1 [Gossypium barbadense]|uniref:Uncharacterized protein n=2 Tax=Gossypium TaxID=3633 RepID=A0A5J5STH2_GOSBA|nr:hypothetical protein ES319_D01G120300v1 [Gossypium barbadense]TYG82974.1 hypothetical protein ES288_D01G131900v1 [Gossypium darwinii]